MEFKSKFMQDIKGQSVNSAPKVIQQENKKEFKSSFMQQVEAERSGAPTVSPQAVKQGTAVQQPQVQQPAQTQTYGLNPVEEFLKNQPQPGMVNYSEEHTTNIAGEYVTRLEQKMLAAETELQGVQVREQALLKRSEELKTAYANVEALREKYELTGDKVAGQAYLIAAERYNEQVEQHNKNLEKLQKDQKVYDKYNEAVYQYRKGKALYDNRVAQQKEQARQEAEYLEQHPAEALANASLEEVEAKLEEMEDLLASRRMDYEAAKDTAKFDASGRKEMNRAEMNLKELRNSISETYDKVQDLRQLLKEKKNRQGAGKIWNSSAGEFVDRVDYAMKAGIHSGFGGLNAVTDAVGNAIEWTIGATIGDIANLTGSEELKKKSDAWIEASKKYEGAEEWQAAADAYMQDALVGAGKVDGWIAQQVQNIGSMMVDMYTVGMGAVASAGTSLALPGNISTGKVMALRAGGSSAMEAAKKGYSMPEQIMVGVATGALEYISEKMFGGNPIYDTDKGWVTKGVEKLFGTNKITKLMYSKGFDLFSEGLEEVFVELTQPVAEGILTSTEIDFASGEDLLNAFAGGMFLSLAGGGAQVVANATADVVTGTAKAKRTAVNAIRNAGAVQDLVNEGLAADPESKAYIMAQKMQKKLDAGKRLSATEIGKQLFANQEAIDAGDLTDAPMEENENAPEGALQKPEDGFYAIRTVTGEDGKTTYQLVQVHSDGSIKTIAEPTADLLAAKVAAEAKGMQVEQIGTMEALRRSAEEAGNEAAEENKTTVAENTTAAEPEEISENIYKETNRYEEPAQMQPETGGIQWAGNEYEEGVTNDGTEQRSAGTSVDPGTERRNDLGTDQRAGSGQAGNVAGADGENQTTRYVENLKRSGSLEEVETESLGYASIEEKKKIAVVPENKYSESMQVLADRAAANNIELAIVAEPIPVKQNGQKFKVAGIHKPGKIVIQANNEQMSMEQAYEHEEFHELADRDPSLVDTVVQTLQDEYGSAELDALWKKYAKSYCKAYNDRNTTDEELAQRIYEEMLADAYAGYERYSGEKKSQKYRETVRKAAEQSRRNKKEQSEAESGKSQTKLNEAERDFEKEVNEDPHIQRLIRMRNRGEISEAEYMRQIDDYFENDAKMRAMTDELVRAGAESFSVEKNAFDAGYKEYDVTTAVYDIRNSPAERHKDLVKIGTMPELYRELFGINGNVYVSNEHLYQNIVSKETAINEGRFKKGDGADYHELGEDRVINAIMQSQNPMVLMESLKDYESPRLVSVVEETGHDEKNLIVVTELYADQMAFGEKQPKNHVLITVYEKRSLPDYVEKTLKKGRVLHIKKGLSPDTQASLQLAGGISEEVLRKNLAQFNKKVKAFKEEKKIDYSVVSEGKPGISWAGSEQTETYEDATPEPEAKDPVGDSLAEEIRHTAGGLESYLAAQPKRVQQRFAALKKESASKFATAIGLQTADGLTETIDELGNEYLENGRISNETRSKLFRILPHANQKDAQSLEEHGDWAWADFNAAINAVCSNLAEVRRVMKQAAEHRKTYKETEGQEQTVAELWVDAKVQRREMEKNKAKYLLTDSDKMIVGRLLRGEMQPEHINRNTNNYRGIMAVYETSQAYEDTMKKLRAYNLARREGLRQLALEIMKDLEKWKDKRMGLAYSIETMERNIRDVAPTPEIAEAFIDAYLTPVHRAAAQENRLKNEMRERVKKLNLSREVKKGNQISESAAVQLLGEARDNIAVLEHRAVGTVRDGKTLQEWKAEIDNLWQNNSKLDRAKIEAAIEEFRKIYDQLFKMMNETRIRNGYEPINYRKGYFPHFQSDSPDTIMAKFGQAFGIQHDIKNLPASIVGMTEHFLPGIPWFQHAMERLAGDATMDAVQGFDQYIEGAANVIYQTDNIQRLRALEQTLRYMASDEGLQKRVEKIRENAEKSDKDKDEEIDRLYKEARFGMSNFIANLQEYTNNLAGKKSRYDRNMEIRLGRNMYNVVKSMEGRVAANMVAINPGSWLTNFAPLAQGTASIGSIAMIRGMASELANGGMASKWELLRIGNGPDGFHEGSTFLTNRRGSERLVQTWSQKTSGVLGSPMQWIDNYVSGSLVRAKYLQNLKAGMSAENAMEDADAWAASIMGDRSKGAMPTIFNEKNPVTKLFTMYQLEVKNNFSWLFKDLPREKRKKRIAAIALAWLRYAIHAWLFNEIYEKIVGRRPAFDPFGMLIETAGDFFGYEVVNAVDFTVDLFNGGDLMLAQETQKQKPVKALGSLAKNALEEMPFVGGFLGGGRIPVSSALPDWVNLGTAAFNGEWESNRRIETIWQEISKPLFYLVPPFGGGQVKKAIETGRAIVNRGSYNASGNLQYPVFADEAGDAIYSTLVGGLLGKSSLKTGAEWVDSGFQGFNKKYTDTYRELIDMDEGDRASWELLQAMRDAEVPEGEDVAAERRRILQESSISGEAKYTVYYNLLASEKEREQMDALEGADLEDVFNLFTAMKEQDKAGDKQLILRSALTEQEKAILFDSTAEKENARLQAATKYVDSFLYADFLEAYAKKYTGENGKVQSYSGERVKEILRTMTGVTNEEKAAIWQITVNGEEGKSNPFSTEIGKEIWDNIQDLYEQIEQDGGIDWAGRY